MTCRTAAAEIVDSIYNQLLSMGNRSANGVYLFAGDRSTEAPFVEESGGVKWVGSTQVLSNLYDEGTTLNFMVDGAAVFVSVPVSPARRTPPSRRTSFLERTRNTAHGYRQ